MYGVGHICVRVGLNQFLVISNHIDGRRRERIGFPAYLLSDGVIAGFAELFAAVFIHIVDHDSVGLFAGVQLIGGGNGNFAADVRDGLAADRDVNIKCRTIAHRQHLQAVQAAVQAVAQAAVQAAVCERSAGDRNVGNLCL